MAHVAVVDADGRLEDGASTAFVPWWSFTKTLIAAATLRLAEEERLALDERLTDLPFTPRQLLQHRAGLGNYGSLPEYHAAVERGDPPWSDAELLDRVPATWLLFAPDTGWAYSNVGYLLLRRLIERCCDTGFAEALHDLVLAPLSLPDSRLAQTLADMTATVFDNGSGYHPGWVFHGTVVGPVSEAALTLHRLLGGDFLSPASLAAMRDAHALGGPIAGRPWTSTGYGLGLMIGTMQASGMPAPLHVLGHSAGGPGSVGAVYHALQADGGRTVAVCVAGRDEGVAETIAVARLAEPGIGTTAASTFR